MTDHKRTGSRWTRHPHNHSGNAGAELTAINDIAPVETRACLLTYDTVYGRFGKSVQVRDGAWHIEGRTILMIEMKSVMGASRALEELAKLLPSDAHKLMPDGAVKDVPLDDLESDDKVLVQPGEKIPADGVVTDGKSAVNEAMITGESTPVEKSAGEQVIGGSINGEGSLTVEVKGLREDSFLSKVIDMVEKAQASESKAQNLADRAAMWLTFIALGLAVPLVVAVSTALAANNGLLIRNRTAFESARKLRAVIFDKTGTLTEGHFGVTDTLVFAEHIRGDPSQDDPKSFLGHNCQPV
jgi:P-type Cu2+ transporter